MKQALAALMLAACWSAPPPPAPAPKLATTVAATTRLGQRLVGPLASLQASCASTERCEVSEDGLEAPDRPPECHADESGADEDLHWELDSGAELAIAPVHCSIAPGLRREAGRYYLFARRGDGWWRSQPLFAFEINDRYCGIQLTAKLESQSKSRVVLRASSAVGCVACNKLGQTTSRLDFSIVVDLGGSTPQVYEPLMVAQRYEQIGVDDDLVPAGAESCPRVDRHVELRSSWSSSGELTLEGPATWLAVPRGPDGVELHGLGEQGATERTPVGTYRFTPSQ